jgi:hypothetical protein
LRRRPNIWVGHPAGDCGWVDAEQLFAGGWFDRLLLWVIARRLLPAYERYCQRRWKEILVTQREHAKWILDDHSGDT